MNYKIGVLGSNGGIGEKLCDILKSNNISFIEVNRTEKKISDNQFIFDVYNESEFNSFLKKVDIVINCIGPTFYYGKYIAEKAITHNKIYIDAFGDEFICRDMKQFINSTVVISSGDCPGFSGIIPFWIKRKYFDSIIKMDISYLSGGEITASGLLDVLMSSNMGYGYIEKYYKSGTVIKDNETLTREYIKYYNKNFYYKEFISNEMIEVANSLKINEFHFKNLYFDEENYSFFKNIYYEIYEQNVLWENIKNILSNKLHVLNDSAYKETLYKIEVSGIKGSKNKTLLLEITATKSYRISAFILYKVLEHILYNSKLIVGILRPFEILDAENIFSEMIEMGLIKRIYKNDSIELKYDMGRL